MFSGSIQQKRVLARIVVPVSLVDLVIDSLHRSLERYLEDVSVYTFEHEEGLKTQELEDMVDNFCERSWMHWIMVGDRSFKILAFLVSYLCAKTKPIGALPWKRPLMPLC